MNIKQLRQRLSSKTFEVSDRLVPAIERLRSKERRLLRTIYLRLPTPGNLLSSVRSAIMWVAFAVDSPCPQCDTSPGHLRSCPLYERIISDRPEA